MTKRDEQTFSSSPEAYKYKTRQFSTADKYSNLQLTAQEVQQLYLQNQKLKNCLATFGITSEFEVNQIIQNDSIREQRRYSTNRMSSGNQMIAWNLSEKNDYLQQKVQKLKIQKEKQTKAIQKIKNSLKWRNRSQCNPLGCYKNKYIKLLKIKCPDTEY